MNDRALFITLAFLTLVGAWAIVNPSGVIGLAKTAHPGLNEDDPSVQSVAKFVGIWFLVLTGLIFFSMLWSQHHS